MAQILYNFNELIVIADNIKLLVLLRKHILARRQWEAGGAREKHPRKLALLLLVLLALVRIGGLQHLSQNATDAPHVDACVILRFAQNYFWCAVPA